MTDLEGEEVFDLTIINSDGEKLLSCHDGKKNIIWVCMDL